MYKLDDPICLQISFFMQIETTFLKKLSLTSLPFHAENWQINKCYGTKLLNK